MAIDFPNSPTNGQLFSSGTITWVYDGSKWNIQSASQSAFSPIGTIVNYGGTLAPTGWLLCNGASYNRTAYPNLFGVISTTFGQGSSPGTTFNVPDFRSNNGNFIIRANDEAVVYTTTESLLAVPIGAMQLFAMNAIPTGWLRADGSAVSRTVYADLFAAIGTTYGSGDGSTTFNLPNIAGSGAGSPLYYIKAIISGIVEPSTVVHGSSHVRGGSDVIDGDRVQVDFVPTTYTRNSAATGAGANTDLTAHLSGIDNKFASTIVASGGSEGTYLDESGATYKYHIFNSTGNLTVTTTGSVIALVVAGGGGGGGCPASAYSGGGGGAGGVLYSALTLTPGTYTATVGLGGAGGASSGARGTSGNNSSFSTLTAIGGGGGAFYNNATGINGGSGGGAGGGSGAANGGTGTSGQGNDGGYHGGGASPYGASGGGGASEPGQNTHGGKGGDGLVFNMTGRPTAYGGGGGGGCEGQIPGAGGLGGGGNGGTSFGRTSTPTSGRANTGGGGGGGGGNAAQAGGSGGSGVVIIKYRIS